MITQRTGKMYPFATSRTYHSRPRRYHDLYASSCSLTPTFYHRHRHRHSPSPAASANKYPNPHLTMLSAHSPIGVYIISLPPFLTRTLTIGSPEKQNMTRTPECSALHVRGSKNKTKATRSVRWTYDLHKQKDQLQTVKRIFLASMLGSGP